MNPNILALRRRRVGFALMAITSAWVLWQVSPGVPLIWTPTADPKVRAVGLELFNHEWQPRDPLAKGDGLGPVFNARSCVACHFQGGVGGGGGNKENVQTFEAHPTKDHPELASGLIHKYAVYDQLRDTHDTLRKLFPIVVNGLRLEGGCQILRQDFDPIRTESINATALFGAGWIDQLAANSICHQNLKSSLASIGRELSSDFQGVSAGRYRVLPDGRIGKFGWKAQFATLEEFVAAACANEIGLGNPRMEQAKPLGVQYQPTKPDLDRAQFRSLVAFVETLPRPERMVPESAAAAIEIKRGEEVFRSVGCAVCHTPDIGGLQGVYSDFLLHRVADRKNEGYRGVIDTEVPLPNDHPEPDEWKTPPLWGVADSAPYFHDGRSGSLTDAILRHRASATPVTSAYESLAIPEQAALVAFLKSLRAPKKAEAAPRSTDQEESSDFMLTSRP